MAQSPSGLRLSKQIAYMRASWLTFEAMQALATNEGLYVLIKRRPNDDVSAYNSHSLASTTGI